MDILIEGFPYITSAHEIKKLFRKYGAVKKVKKEKARSCATVSMPHIEQARKAIDALNGSTLFDKCILVREK